MNSPPRNVAQREKLTADNEGPGEAMVPGSDGTPQPDCESPLEHHVRDDAAGDEGIDDPAVDD